jgi:hypothetical protein
MSLVNIDTQKGAIAGVDEAARVIVPQLPAILDQFARTLASALSDALKGRVVTVTIKVE